MDTPTPSHWILEQTLVEIVNSKGNKEEHELQALYRHIPNQGREIRLQGKGITYAKVAQALDEFEIVIVALAGQKRHQFQVRSGKLVDTSPYASFSL